MQRADSSSYEDWHRFLGWGRAESISADLFDAIFENARMTGMWGKKPPKPFPTYPGRPTQSKSAPKEKVTVKGLFERMSKSGVHIHGG